MKIKTPNGSVHYTLKPLSQGLQIFLNNRREPGEDLSLVNKCRSFSCLPFSVSGEKA